MTKKRFFICPKKKKTGRCFTNMMEKKSENYKPTENFFWMKRTNKQRHSIHYREKKILIKHGIKVKQNTQCISIQTNSLANEVW